MNKIKELWFRLRLWFKEAPEKFWIWLAWKLPRKLAYWCSIRVGAHATTGFYGHTIVPELHMMDMFKRWDTPFIPPSIHIKE